MNIFISFLLIISFNFIGCIYSKKSTYSPTQNEINVSKKDNKTKNKLVNKKKQI